MRVTVTLKKNGKFHRVENGRMRFYTAKDEPFTVSQHVFEAFRDRFNVVGEAPAPAAAPVGQTPGTDDAPEPVEPIGGFEEEQPEDPQELPIVAALASVGITVLPKTAAAWTEAEMGRAFAVVDRQGKGNLPKFLLAAIAPPVE